ncbi:enhancer of mRNA-decapping protein 3 [Salvelinus sp. IW2-2015]|uniref:enhancer of mRNA-decapping protein 3 n=1 Tax=Salvelinus sp. IW2-2015 TaxID=2691554 RepID=UPI0038D3C769
MAADWLGSLVSINCGPTLGMYQGEVSSVDQTSQTISLRQPFHNGVRCHVPEVTFSAMDIRELKFLDIQTQSGVSRASAGQGILSDPGVISSGQSGQNSRGGYPANNTHSTTTPITILRKGEMRGLVWEFYFSNWLQGPDATSPQVTTIGLGDFLYTDSGTPPSISSSPEATKKLPNHLEVRCSYIILEVKPVVYRQITVPQHGGKEYCTDSGLVVPSVSYELHKCLLASAERHGLSLERRLEMTGVCASQMALTLLGGPNRLTPKNNHQRPTVALLCGPHVQGAQGISCGRHLANHEVEVILFLPNFVKMQESITNELALYSKTSGKQVASIKDLPVSPVDLVINCLDCHENGFLRDQAWYLAAADWANQNRAPVLSIDPPVSGQKQAVEAKWTLSLGLPLPIDGGEARVYLCDIGVPKQVFQEVGINYHSPFGCKFVIPLHSA